MKSKLLSKLKIKNKLFLVSSILVIIGILSISLGYSAFFTTLSIQNNLTYVRLNRNIRVTALSVEPTNPSVAQDFYHEYNEHTLAHRIRLANNNSSITYKVKVTNFGNSVEGILDINNLPSELTYTLSGYDLRTKMCNGSNCANGMQKEFYITFKYKDPSIVRGVRDFEMVLDVVFSPFYTVTYNVNGGNPISPISKDVMYKDYYGTLPEPFRVGYTFNGWKYNGATITATSIMNTAGNHTLTAAWTPNNYTVVFNSNGGSVSPTSKTVTYDSTYGTLPTPTRRGYTFNGWFTMPSGGDQVLSTSHVAITSTQVLYAHWTPNNYTVTFNPNNGSVTPSSKIVTYDSTYGTLPTPTRTGYRFDGWFTALTGGDQVVSTTVVNIIANQTLYAHWTPIVYTVTFNGNGGSTPSPTSKQVTYDSTYGTLATTSKTGYDFKGWFTAASGGTQILDTTTVKITSNTTLYAHWEPKTFTVTYNANGGSVSPASKTVTYDSTYGTLATPTRTGYTFDGWFTEASGGTQITSSTAVTILANQTIYAHWTINYYYVDVNTTVDGVTNNGGHSGFTFDVYINGSLVSNDVTDYYQQHPYGTVVRVVANGKTGYDLTNGDVTQTIGEGAINFSPTWTVKTFTVTFNKNGGGTPSPTSKTVTYGSTYGTLASVSRTGYNFDGWYTAASGGTRIYDTSTVSITSNQTLYAHWSNTPPTKPTMSVVCSNGCVLNSSGYETVTVTLSGSTDAEDGTPTYSFTSSTGTVTPLGGNKWSVTFTETGFFTLTGKATDLAGEYAVDVQVLRIKGGSSSSSGTGQFNSSGYFDSGWISFDSNLYIKSYTYKLQIPYGHSNGNNNDYMRTTVRYNDGTTEMIYNNVTNLGYSLWTDSNTFTIPDTGTVKVPVAIKFEAYSPHTTCVPSATISFDLDVEYDSRVG